MPKTTRRAMFLAAIAAPLSSVSSQLPTNTSQDTIGTLTQRIKELEDRLALFEGAATLVPRLVPAVPELLDAQAYDAISARRPDAKPHIEQLAATARQLKAREHGIEIAPIPYMLAILEQETAMAQPFKEGRLAANWRQLASKFVSNRDAVGSAQATPEAAQKYLGINTRIYRTQASQRAWALYKKIMQTRGLEQQMLASLYDSADEATGSLRRQPEPAVLSAWKRGKREARTQYGPMERDFNAHRRELAMKAAGKSVGEVGNIDERFLAGRAAEFLIRYLDDVGKETGWNTLRMSASYYSGTSALSPLNLSYAVSVQERMLRFVSMLNNDQGLRIRTAQRTYIPRGTK